MLRGFRLWLTVGLAAAVLIGLSVDLPGVQAFSAIQKPYPAWVLPDPHLTPGDINQNITEQVIRDPNFRTSKYRDVTTDEKKLDAQEYDVSWADHRKYEFDHFIPVEIGGSNDIKNLWPEPLHLNVRGYDLGSKTKDKVEDALGELVKSGQMPLAEAQKEILDWPAAYEQYVGPFPAYRGN